MLALIKTRGMVLVTSISRVLPGTPSGLKAELPCNNSLVLTARQAERRISMERRVDRLEQSVATSEEACSAWTQRQEFRNMQPRSISRLCGGTFRRPKNTSSGHISVHVTSCGKSRMSAFLRR
jgi:hypothetical protein